MNRPVQIVQSPASSTNHPRQQLELLRLQLNDAFLERDHIIDGFLSALLSKQHILLLGPPGTAKSALAQTTCEVFDNAGYFSWLLTRFSTPEEVFGPISLSALQQDRFERKTDGKLPESHVAFLDEIFKANSSILNALLTLINERKYHNGTTSHDCPLVTVVGASNELPEGDELEALFDRFAVRFWVDYLTDTDNVRTLLIDDTPRVSVSMSLNDLETLQHEASQVNIPDTTIDGIIAVKSRLEHEGYRSSDRRWKHILSMLKAYAYLQGDDEVTEEHFDLLPDMLWREPNERNNIAGIVASVGNPINIKAQEISDAAKEEVKELGSFAGSTAGEKAEWLKSASLTDTTLQQMESELETLIDNHPNTRTRKAKVALVQVQKLRKEVMGKIANLYNL